jgi:uncharacterized SAM-binding protein YcdF (DUF218 family)
LNDLLNLLGLTAFKPLLAALLLPPAPLLLMVLVGARLLLPRRGLGWLIIVIAVILLWLSACSGTERLLTPLWLKPPPVLAPERIAELRAGKASGKTAIVVLGGGAQPVAPEYGISNLGPESLERLRYGIWLARQTGLPVAFSGGVGWAAADATPEAEIAARVAKQEFGVPIRWVESRSRDTRGNAGLSVAMLREAGIDHVLLVTHDYHMPRAARAFREAGGSELRVEPAPMGRSRHELTGALEWIPSSIGFTRVRHMLRELAGLAFGA